MFLYSVVVVVVVVLLKLLFYWIFILFFMLKQTYIFEEMVKENWEESLRGDREKFYLWSLRRASKLTFKALLFYFLSRRWEQNKFLRDMEMGVRDQGRKLSLILLLAKKRKFDTQTRIEVRA